MATESTITDESVRTALVERLKATHVEVTDMSGKYLPNGHAHLIGSLCVGVITGAWRHGWDQSAHTFPWHQTADKVAGGCGQAFTTLIVSPEFAGKNSLKRHRLVNAALKEEIAQIHAWTAKCQTPEEWERDKAAKGGSDGPPMDGTVDGKVEGDKE